LGASGQWENHQGGKYKYWKKESGVCDAKQSHCLPSDFVTWSASRNSMRKVAGKSVGWPER